MYGLTYQVGKPKSSLFKIELATRKTKTEVSPLVHGTENSLGIEGMNKTFYAGFTISQLKGITINYQDIVDALVSERVSSNTTTTKYSITAGFRTKAGHSLGVSGSTTKEEIPSRVSYFNSNTFDSQMESTSISASTPISFRMLLRNLVRSLGH